MRRGSIFWGIILVLAGVLFLLSNLGFIKVDVWNLLWPFFLIALGIAFLWGTVFRTSSSGEHVNIPMEGAGRARLRVRHGAGRLAIKSGTQAGDLVEGYFGGGLDYRTRRSGDELDVEMSMPPQSFPFAWGPGYNLDWNFQLSGEIPINLNVEGGANDAVIDLSDLRIDELTLKSGASSTQITMPANAGMTHTRIETGAASVKVHVPEGVAARIRAQGGLASIQIDTARFPPQGDLYKSSDYDVATNRIDFDIQLGVGAVQIS
jgi:LiaI-LiaF-like transmembrane region